MNATRIRHSGRGASLLLLALLANLAPAEIKRIEYEDPELQRYSITWDSEKLKGYDMNDIVWMSPYYQPPGNERFDVGGSEDGPGRPAKQIGINLTVVPHPGAARRFATGEVITEGQPGSLENWRFMESNIAFGRSQVQDLQRMKLPRVLEPVRKYLIFYASLDVDWAQAQYDYARNGDVAPIREVFCRTCGCSVASEALLRRVREAADVRARLDASGRLTAPLKMCNGLPKFPLESWQQFLRQYDVKETNVFTAPL